MKKNRKSKPNKKVLTKPAKKIASAGKKTKPAAKARPEKLAKQKPAKKEELKQKVLTNPFENFLQLWKPRSENFEAGLEKLFKEYPGSEKNREAVVEKILTTMRKEAMPSVVEEQLNERFQRDRVHKISTILSMRPRTSLRLNTLKADLLGFASSRAAEELKIKRSHLSPWGFEVGKVEDAIKHPAHERGLFEIQDEAAQLISLLVNARPGQRILDLNAGEGGNALALSAMMRNKGSLFIYDSESKKLKNFRERGVRAGIDNFRILSDAQISEVKGLDAVLIEAPSSSVGKIGQHPDLKWRFSKDDLPRIQKLQAALLREGARKLKLGGYLIYSTYTLNKSENEQQIEHFIRSTHNSYRVVPAVAYMKEFIVPYVQNFFGFQWDEKTLSGFGEFDPYFVLSPDTHSSPGVFAAIIQRIRIST